MRRTWVVLLTIGVSFSVFSQTKMFINKVDGTSDSLLLSDFKSISFKPGSSTPITPTDMIQVAGGTFQMGSTDPNDDARPPHSVTVGTFYIDRTQITYEKWTDVRTWGLAHGYTDLVAGRNGKNGTTNHPVTEVTWYDVLKWCNARSEKEGLTAVYYTRNALDSVYRTGQLDLASDAVNWTASGYRLPTEGEFEFASRGGTKALGFIYSGSNGLAVVGWFNSNSGDETHPVALKQVNELGLYDMSGNVWEWTWDWYGAFSASAQTDPRGPPSGKNRIVRGGSFSQADYFCRVTFRAYFNPGTGPGSFYFIGFRCVRD